MEATMNKMVKTDCCDNIDEFGIADELGTGRVRVDGNCPACGTEQPRGTLAEQEEENV